MSKLDKLKALINHPATPEFERIAAVRIAKAIIDKERQVKLYVFKQLVERSDNVHN